jgi:hypothetical protein
LRTGCITYVTLSNENGKISNEERKRLEIIWKIGQIMLIVEFGIVKFREFYYLCKVKLQHAAKISCRIAMKFKAFLLSLQGIIAACCKNIL